MLLEILDRNTAIAQDTGITIDKGDLALTTSGVSISGVQGDQTGPRTQITYVNGLLIFTAGDDGQFVRLVAYDKRGFVPDSVFRISIWHLFLIAHIRSFLKGLSN